MPTDPFPFPTEVYPENWFTELTVSDWFSKDQPLEIDLGCGDGSFLAAMGKEFPERNFLGVERLLGRCRKVWKKAERNQLENVKILRIDTNYAINYLLPKGQVSRLHFLCPDPWPKKKHAARRQMCQPQFLASIHALLADDGEFLFKTDSREYFDESLEVLEEIDFFRQADWGDSEFFYPITDFEKQWLDMGRTMNRLRLTKL